MKVHSKNSNVSIMVLLRLLILPLFVLVAGCSSGSSGGDDNPSSDPVADGSGGDIGTGGDVGGDGGSDTSTGGDNDTGGSSQQGGAPAKLIANAFSGTSIGLSWERDGTTYSIYRNGEKIAETSNHYFVDQGLSINTEHTYTVTAGDVDNDSDIARVSAKTLLNNTNSGLSSGADIEVDNDRISNFAECNNARSALDLLDADLDSCLQAMLELNGMASHLEDIRAFAARVRSEQSPAKVELGMRLFHNKSLSANNDTSCSSCHQPVMGCGGDNLSMPIGVSALDPALVGPGRSDGFNEVPVVARNAQPICNAALWTRGLFWDNRVAITDRGLRTDSRDVSNNTEAAVGIGTLALMMAQAHFPVTDAAEMGDITQFGYDNTIEGGFTAYREEILAANLESASWSSLFSAAFGDPEINFSRVAEAIAAYEAVQLFIDNPFFDYVDGNPDALDSDEKRGAITFMAGNSGCTNCHGGAFFTTQGLRAVNYPQIGVGKDASGSGADLGGNGAGSFRIPTLLNVAITGPWGHNGQFATLRRNIEHYRDRSVSITRYFANSEMCDLEQFVGLQDCANKVAPNGLAHTQDILSANGGGGANNLSDTEIDLVVKFLGTLTDPDAANTNSNAIQALMPPRDGGPDGRQLEAKDREGNAL
ncbi:cytochrome c peroxidase [Microbulbifer sp. VTAC004]|uniref:cytochrome c peroxidase n=1 Tax=Microbulbifer sp. VTAC004 TaxID=3243386 RepID=UPI0040392ECA